MGRGARAAIKSPPDGKSGGLEESEVTLQNVQHILDKRVADNVLAFELDDSGAAKFLKTFRRIGEA